MASDWLTRRKRRRDRWRVIAAFFRVAECKMPTRVFYEGFPHIRNYRSSYHATRVHWCRGFRFGGAAQIEMFARRGSGMWKDFRFYVMVAALPLLCAAVFIAAKLSSTARLLSEGERSRREMARVIRRPNARTPEPDDKIAHNIAPFATVTVSSIGESEDRMGGGVADGIVDTHEWVTGGEMGGAWIRLTWHIPATVNGVELYDRPNQLDNVLSGRLTFDDGGMIPVPALPPRGAPWRITFPPKLVHWLEFRIDRAEGKNTGLEEITVFGTLNP